MRVDCAHPLIGSLRLNLLIAGNLGFRAARRLIGLVPQEMALEPFESVIRTVQFSRGLFGKPRDAAEIERILWRLSLWDKRNSPTK